MSDEHVSDVEVRFYQWVIDCADPRTLAAFWLRFTGFEVSQEGDDWFSIRSPDDRTRIGFQQVPETKTVKNRVHLDFSATDEEAAASGSKLWAPRVVG